MEDEKKNEFYSHPFPLFPQPHPTSDNFVVSKLKLYKTSEDVETASRKSLELISLASYGYKDNKRAT